jgi:Homeodomain-like domain-containing protein
MPSTLLQKLLADLLSARARAATPAEQTAIDGAIADVAAGLHAGGGLPENAVSSLKEVNSPGVVAERPMSRLSPFYGLGLKEACAKLLSLVPEKQAMTAREIWEQLKAEGWTSNHNNPPHSVNDALRRRAKTHGDVLLVGAGKWGKPSWYDDDELEEIRKSIGGMGGRDRGDHVERTKAGMATARQRGARLGAVKKLSEEQGRQIVDLVRAGATKEKIATQFGISPTSVSNYLKAYTGYSSVRQLRREEKNLRAAAVTGSTEEEPGETRH